MKTNYIKQAILFTLILSVSIIVSCRQVAEPSDRSISIEPVSGGARVLQGGSIELAVKYRNPLKEGDPDDIRWSILSMEQGCASLRTGESSNICIITGEAAGDVVVQAVANKGDVATFRVSIYAPMVLTYMLPVGGIDDFTLPLRTEGDKYDLIVDWGDGSETTSVTRASDAIHSYDSVLGGTPVDITIYGDLRFGDIDGDRPEDEPYELTGDWDDGSWGDPMVNPGQGNRTPVYNSSHYLVRVKSFGSSQFINNRYTFAGVSNNFSLPLDSNDVPHIVGDAIGMFEASPKFNQDISNWDISKVTDFRWFFHYTEGFNNGGKPLGWNGFGENIGEDESVNMYSMFKQARSFNQNIGDWDVSRVTDMGYMFGSSSGCPMKFNQDISDWDVSNVIDMSGMFYNSGNFNQDISKWDVSNVEKWKNFDKNASKNWTSEAKPEWKVL